MTVTEMLGVNITDDELLNLQRQCNHALYEIKLMMSRTLAPQEKIREMESFDLDTEALNKCREMLDKGWHAPYSTAELDKFITKAYSSALQSALVTSGLNNVGIYGDTIVAEANKFASGATPKNGTDAVHQRVAHYDPDAAENNAYILFGVNDVNKLTISLAYSGGSDYYLYGSEMTFLEVYEDLLETELTERGNALMHERVIKAYGDYVGVINKLNDGAYDRSVEQVREDIRSDAYGNQLYKFCCNPDNIGKYSAIVSAFCENAPVKAQMQAMKQGMSHNTER